MICQDCKFYNSTRNGICGLALDCTDAITENSCDFKVIGEPVLVKLEKGNKWEFEPGNSLDQAPKIEGLVYYHRKHINLSSTTRKVEITIAIQLKPRPSLEHFKFEIVKVFPLANFKKVDAKAGIYEAIITWTENKREAFKTKLAKKRRLHTI